MRHKLIVDGNAVYELDEKCMLKKRQRHQESGKAEKMEKKKREK